MSEKKEYVLIIQDYCGNKTAYVLTNSEKEIFEEKAETQDVFNSIVDYEIIPIVSQNINTEYPYIFVPNKN